MKLLFADSVQSDERLPFERVPAEEHFPRPSIPVPVPAPIPPIHQKYAIKVEISKPSEDEDLLIGIYVTAKCKYTFRVRTFIV